MVKIKPVHAACILLSILCTYSMQMYISSYSDMIWVFLCPLYAVIFLHVFRKKYNCAVIGGGITLGAVYAVMSFLDYELTVNGGIDLYPKALIFLLGSTVFFSTMLIWLISFLINLESPCISCRKGRHTYIARTVTIGAVLVLCWLPYYLACFPGNINSDVVGEFRQHIGTARLSNHHPVIHQLMLKCGLDLGRLFNSYNTGIGIYTALQLIITALIVAYCIESVRRMGAGKLAISILLLYYAFSTTIGFYSVSLIKDIPFAGITLLLITLLIKELNGDFLFSRFQKLFSIAAISLTSFLFCTVRNNGYYAFILGMAAIILFNIRKNGKRLLLIGCITLLMVSGYKYVLFDVLDVEQSSSGEMLALPLQAIARTVKEDSPDLTDDDFLTLSEIFPDYELLAGKYIPDNSDSIKSLPVFDPDFFEKNPAKYLKCWIRIGLKHPRTYIEAFLLHTHGFWSFENTAQVSPYVWPNEFGIIQNTRFGTLKHVLSELHYFLCSVPPVSVLYSFGILIILLLFCITLYILKGTLRKYSPVFIIAFLWLTAIAAPACLYQYVYGLTTTVPVFLVMALIPPRNSQNEATGKAPLSVTREAK